jgi:hypothetical protein
MIELTVNINPDVVTEHQVWQIERDVDVIRKRLQVTQRSLDHTDTLLMALEDSLKIEEEKE